MNMDRCKKCGRIPLYCNCDFDKIYATLPISEPLTYEEIEIKLRNRGIVGQASFIQSEKNADGKVKTYWINYWLEQKNIPCLFKSDGKIYETNLSAMNGILSNL